MLPASFSEIDERGDQKPSRCAYGDADPAVPNQDPEEEVQREKAPKRVPRPYATASHGNRMPRPGVGTLAWASVPE